MMLVDVCIPTRSKRLFKKVYQSIKREIPYRRIILEHAVPLSLARKLLIEKAQTEWFLFLDDDVILGKNWFKKVSRYMDDDVGAIEGIDIGKKRCLEIKRYERGLLLATLIRRSLVQDWIPRKGFESNFEDYDLTQHVIKKGYRWLRVNVPGTRHISFHPHASQTGFEVFLSEGFSNRERLLYLIHLARIYSATSISGKMILNYVNSIFLWLKNHK